MEDHSLSVVIFILSGISNCYNKFGEDIRIMVIFYSDHAFWMTLRYLSVRKKSYFLSTANKLRNERDLSHNTK